VPCDVFVTEATVGTPGYRWDRDADLGREIFDWWQDNAARGCNSVLFAYALGKAQRVLGALAPLTKRAVYCHPAVTEINKCYRESGIVLAPTYCLSEVERSRVLRGELVLVPPAFLQSEQAQVLGDGYRTAFASGWMSKRATDGKISGYGDGYDHGFVMSDHADWADLVRTVLETGAQRVYVQHRGQGALVRHLRSLGLRAYPDAALKPENPHQLSLFL
jgi:putative mRNA 3-end processing factor